jgi:threonine/homoserine/homoserine lactone efflux protein
MSIETYLLYLRAVAVFFLTPPGTSQLLIISNSIRHGQKRSMFTVVGDLTANCLQMICAAFGLAVIITTSATAFIFIKWIGVAYLAWIGLRLVLRTESSQEVQANSTASGFRLCRN